MAEPGWISAMDKYVDWGPLPLTFPGVRRSGGGAVGTVIDE